MLRCQATSHPLEKEIHYAHRLGNCAQLLCLLAGFLLAAQETRSTISGTVRDEQGVIPGASVKVINVGTGVTQQLTTNSSGYFEAPLLIAGTYEVVVEMTGFKTLRRTGVTLSSGQQLALPLALEIGTIAEEITVTGEAPLLEVNTLRQGLVLDEKKITELPVQSNMPVLFARFAPGMMARGVIPFAGQGFVGGPTTNATPLGGVGGVDWSIDGATNSGVNRQMSTSPNTDMVQEMRVESTNFTASIGHGTGVGISMMTKAGTNTLARHGEPPGTGRTSSTRRIGFSKSCSTGILAPGTAYEEGLLAQSVVDVRRPCRDSGAHQRHEQAVHVR